MPGRANPVFDNGRHGGRCAHGVASADRTRQGLRIPQDVAIAGFGGFPIADKLLPSLTTLSPNYQRIGEIAADMVLSYYTHEK